MCPSSPDFPIGCESRRRKGKHSRRPLTRAFCSANNNNMELDYDNCEAIKFPAAFVRGARTGRLAVHRRFRHGRAVCSFSLENNIQTNGTRGVLGTVRLRCLPAAGAGFIGTETVRSVRIRPPPWRACCVYTYTYIHTYPNGRRQEGDRTITTLRRPAKNVP